MNVKPLGDRLKAWRLARNLSLSEALAELGRRDSKRCAVHFSPWTLEAFEHGAKPLPDERAALLEILAQEAVAVPGWDQPMFNAAAA